MNTIRTAALVAALATASASSLGQERAAPPPASADPPAATETPAPPPTEQRGVVKDGEFIPTQELAPDEDVTFPVDI